MLSNSRFWSLFKKPAPQCRATLVMTGRGNEQNHKREVVICTEMDIDGLRMVSIGLFKEASLTLHLVDNEFIENASKMIHFYRDDGEGGKVKINNIMEIRNGDEVTVSFKGTDTMKRIHEVFAEEKKFKLWCGVHSTGQGYIMTVAQEGQEYLEFSSHGTRESAEAFELQLADHQLPNVTYYRICLHYGDTTYYFCHGNDGTVLALTDVQKSISFDIIQCEGDVRHSAFTFNSGDELKMLIIDSNDMLKSTSVNKRIGAGRFIDPAGYFAVAVV